MYLKTCPTCHARYPVEFEVCRQDGSRLESENGAAEAPTEWPTGKVVGSKYRISSRLGEDEVATIYEAHTLALNAPRVIRVLHPRFAAHAAACEEFRKASDLLQKAAQTNVIAVEGRGNAEDGRPFLVTEFVRGQTLAELMREEGPIEPLRACSIIRQVALALASAHRLGLLHLSLTPSNILVSGGPDEEGVKVQGFGAAYVRMSRTRNGRSSPSLTLRDHLPGDPRYASPELALGTPPELLDERTDLYSLGIVFYEMLTGRLPFAGPVGGRDSGVDGSAQSDVATLVARLEDLPAPLGAGYGGIEIPAPLVDLAMQLLERRPELRLASAREVIEKIALAETRITSLAETRITSLASPSLRPQPSESKPATPAQIPASLPEEPLELAEKEPAPELELVPVLSASSEAPLDALDLKLGGDAVTVPQPVAVAAGEVPVVVPPVISESPRSRRDTSSILFKTEQAPKPSHFGRWALAAAGALVLAAGAWFFITRARSQWLGAGPLSPIKSDELRSVEGANPSTSPPAQSTSPPVQSQIGAPPAGQVTRPSQQPAPQPQTGPPSSSQPAALRRSANAQAAGGAQTGGPTPAAGLASASTASKPPATPASASSGAPPAASPEDIAAQVKRAIAAGDVFFELGQYDYAIRAYQGPLKYDPLNQELKLKIERARKAKAAEEQYLGQ
jgi:serine/threonine protein kinase